MKNKCWWRFTTKENSDRVKVLTAWICASETFNGDFLLNATSSIGDMRCHQVADERQKTLLLALIVTRYRWAWTSTQRSKNRRFHKACLAMITRYGLTCYWAVVGHGTTGKEPPGYGRLVDASIRAYNAEAAGKRDQHWKWCHRIIHPWMISPIGKRQIMPAPAIFSTRNQNYRPDTACAGNPLKIDLGDASPDIHGSVV